MTRTSTGAAFRAISETAPQFLLGAPYAGKYGTCDSHLALSLDHQQRNLGRLHRLSFWDALVVRAALDAGCAVLYTEDLAADQRIEGLRIVNPFPV